jgi:hypothetical protein
LPEASWHKQVIALHNLKTLESKPLSNRISQVLLSAAVFWLLLIFSNPHTVMAEMKLQLGQETCQRLGLQNVGCIMSGEQIGDRNAWYLIRRAGETYPVPAKDVSLLEWRAVYGRGDWQAWVMFLVALFFWWLIWRGFGQTKAT